MADQKTYVRIKSPCDANAKVRAAWRFEFNIQAGDRLSNGSGWHDLKSTVALDNAWDHARSQPLI